MNSKCFLAAFLGALFVVASARPKNKILNLGTESEAETKIREKRKYEIPLLRQLEESGVGVKRESPSPPPTPTPVEGEEAAKEGSPSPSGRDEKPEIPPEEVQPGLRIKKQSPNNVGGCGKTVCGPIVSARGPVVSDMRSMVQQGGKPPMLHMSDLSAGLMNGMNDAASKLDRVNPVQGRTIDTIIAPVTLGTMGYGAPASYSAPATADLSHSFFKPPPVPSLPAVAVIAAPHQPSHPLIHPLLIPHLMPHIMPSLMSGLGSYIPHRLEPTRYEPVQTEIKQPLPYFSPPLPSYQVSSDNTLVCQPMRNQRLDAQYDYIYKPDIAIDKSLNVTDGSKKSQDDDSDRRIQEHLRKVNEIKEEISQLNRAAQRIVDQQERLQQMQQKQLGWGGSGSSGQSSPQTQMSNPYMGSGYYSHPSMPWGYSRSNILSFPNSHDDIDFFLNLLRAGKRIGYISDAFQPNVAPGSGDVLKGGQDVTKTQKDVTDTGAQGDDAKGKKQEKKSS